MTTTVDHETQLRHLRLAAKRNGLKVAEFVLPTDQHVLTGDIRLHYLNWSAPPGARDVLFLHGGALTAHTWDLVSLGLADRYHCIALDQRGHGDSEWAPDVDYSTEAHVYDIERFVNMLDLEDFVLVGMSLGGINSIEYAARHSDRLKGLVIVDVGPRVHTPGAARVRDFVSHDAELDSVEDFVERALRFNPNRDRDLLRVSLRHNLRQLPNGRWTWKYDRRRYGQTDYDEVQRRKARLVYRFPEIRCPALVVRGERSDVLFSEDAEEVASLLPNGRHVTIANAGHTVQGDNPRGLVAELLVFFSEIGA